MDIEKIEQLIQVVKGSEVSELSLESEGAKVKIRKGHASKPGHVKKQAQKSAKKAAGSSASVPADRLVDQKEAVVIAPMVGIFHSFNGSVTPGTVIKAGQVIGSIESMKLMNDVTADVDGVVAEVLIEDGMPVEYGQSLLRLVCD